MDGVSGFVDALRERGHSRCSATARWAPSPRPPAPVPRARAPSWRCSPPSSSGALHRRYLDAGAEVIQTHTYGASRLRLARHGLAGRVRDINLAAARLARQVSDEAAPDRPVFVAGSVSPATSPRAAGPVDPAAVRAAIREQVGALHEGGVDLSCSRPSAPATSSPQAVEAAREATRPPGGRAGHVRRRGRRPGDHPRRDPGAGRRDRRGAAPGRRRVELHPRAAGAARGGAPDGDGRPGRGAGHRAAQRRAAPRRLRPLGALRLRRRALRRATPRTTSPPGARLVGGCCGTTPAHVAAAARALAEAPALDRC